MICFIVSTLKLYAKKEYNINQGDLRWLTDSLNRQGIDTIISYYQGCASCMCGVQERTYVYWVKNGKFNIAIPSVQQVKKKSRKSFKYFLVSGDFRSDNYFMYLKDMITYAKSEILLEGKLLVLNYSFEELSIKIGIDKYKISFSDYDRKANFNRYNSIIIDKFLLYISPYIYLN